jgi:hypothetical protein
MRSLTGPCPDVNAKNGERCAARSAARRIMSATCPPNVAGGLFNTLLDGQFGSNRLKQNFQFEWFLERPPGSKHFCHV